jgi:hypothetical protein
MREYIQFSNVITNTDKFINLPLESQALYFHMVMNVDASGYVRNTKAIIKTLRCSTFFLDSLIVSDFVDKIDENEYCVTDWDIHCGIDKVDLRTREE